MKKANIIKDSDEFSNIIRKKNGIVNNFFILNYEENNFNKPMFGITFVKGIGNAVTRNKLKRQIKSIIDNNKNIYQNNKNYIIIIRKDAVGKKYVDLEINLVNIFNRLKEKNNEK